MALAIRIEQLRRDGQVKDQVERAEFGDVTQAARVTQVRNLLSLAPDNQ